VLIGYGAKLAGGCTSGNGICGTALGSPASFAASASFMATARRHVRDRLGDLMAVRAAALGFGLVFGFAISWGQFTDPDQIRAMLLLQDPYLYLMMATSVVVGFVGVRLLRRGGARALLTGEPVAWRAERTERRHVVGAAIFGLGWAITDSCPAQLAQGVLWSLFTIAGVFVGIYVFFRRQERAAEAGRPAPAALGAAASTVAR